MRRNIWAKAIQLEKAVVYIGFEMHIFVNPPPPPPFTLWLFTIYKLIMRGKCKRLTNRLKNVYFLPFILTFLSYFFRKRLFVHIFINIHPCEKDLTEAQSGIDLAETNFGKIWCQMC